MPVIVTRRRRRVHPVFALKPGQEQRKPTRCTQIWKFHHPGRRAIAKDFLFVEIKQLISCGISTIMTWVYSHVRIDVDHPDNPAICPGGNGGVVVRRPVAAVSWSAGRLRHAVDRRPVAAMP
jgi:hypothetical protein